MQPAAVKERDRSLVDADKADVLRKEVYGKY